MILLIDNYDSFSYNLYQFIGEINPDIKIVRNDECTAEEIIKLHPERIIISPGPGRPEDAGICMDLIRKVQNNIPILGVCLGHQAICSVFGADITYAKKLMHGKQSAVKFNNKSPLFKNCPEISRAARYHSLAADSGSIPPCLEIIAVSEDREIMAVQHKKYKIYGVQFHPESVMTPFGKQMIENFIKEDM